MAWTVLDFDEKTDNNNIVSITSRWQAAGEDFTYTDERVNKSPGGRAAYKTAANAALSVYQARLTRFNSIKTQLEIELNS